MKLLYWSKIVCCLSLVIFLGFGSYFLWTTTRAIKNLGNQASTVLVQTTKSLNNLDTAVSKTSRSLSSASEKLGGTSVGINTTLQSINRNCVPGPCGTLADVNKTLGTFRLTAGQLEIAANHEDKNLSVLDSQEETIFDDFHGMLGRVNPMVSQYTEIGTNVNTLLKKQAVSDFVDNLGPLSKNFVAISGTGEHMLQTGDQVETKATYTYLHPSKNPFVRTWNIANPFLAAGAKISAAIF